MLLALMLTCSVCVVVVCPAVRRRPLTARRPRPTARQARLTAQRARRTARRRLRTAPQARRTGTQGSLESGRTLFCFLAGCSLSACKQARSTLLTLHALVRCLLPCSPTSPTYSPTSPTYRYAVCEGSCSAIQPLVTDCRLLSAAPVGWCQSACSCGHTRDCLAVSLCQMLICSCAALCLVCAARRRQPTVRRAQRTAQQALRTGKLVSR
jgi:hypothetical protein